MRQIILIIIFNSAFFTSGFTQSKELSKSIKKEYYDTSTKEYLATWKKLSISKKAKIQEWCRHNNFQLTDMNTKVIERFGGEEYTIITSVKIVSNEDALFLKARKARNIVTLHNYLKLYPKGIYKNDVESLLIQNLSSVNKCFEYAKMLPKLKSQIENKARSIAEKGGFEEMSDYIVLFPSSQYSEALSLKFCAYESDRISVIDLLNESKRHGLIIKNCLTLNALKKAEKNKDLSGLLKIKNLNTTPCSDEAASLAVEIVDQGDISYKREYVKNYPSNSIKYSEFKKMVDEEDARIAFATEERRKRAYEKLLSDELDNIRKYVVVEGQFRIDEQTGDDLGWWQSIWSSTVSTENRNVFLSGRLKNYGNKSKKVLIKGIVNIRVKEKSMWGSSNDVEQIGDDFFMILPPGESRDFVIMCKYTNKAKSEQLFLWGENSYFVFIDRDDPARIELEYFDHSVSQSTLNHQNRLVQAYQRSGNIVTRKTSFENLYNKSRYATKNQIEFEYGEWKETGLFSSSSVPASSTKARKIKFECPQDSVRPGYFVSEYIGLRSDGQYCTGTNVCGLFSEYKFSTFDDAKNKTVECSCY